MTLRPLEIMVVSEEISATLRGKSVQKIVQPDARTLLLGFTPAWLLLSVDTRFGRLHLLDDKPPGTGATPPAFCMLARKHLMGARLRSLQAVPGERAVSLEFSRSGGPEAPPGKTEEVHRLLAFFYGAGGRIALVDAEGRELGALGAARGPCELPPPRVDDRGARFGPPHVSAQIEAHYRDEVAAAAIAAHRQQHLTVARREIARLRRLHEQLEGDLGRSSDAAELRRDADLLLAHLAEVPRGAAEVTVSDDFAGGEARTIRLDPMRSPTEQATRLYREYQRRRRGRALIEKRLTEVRAELGRWERRLEAVEHGGELPAAVASPSPSRSPRRQIGSPRPRPPYHRYRSASGYEILVGRNAAKNDELTFHIARGDDLWLHTRDVPGAHVVVALGGRPLTEDTLLDAATLAVYHSPAREEAQADVTYAPRKLLRKPRGASPGQVSIAGGKTLRLRMESGRLERLLATRRGDDDP
ncbi:MAG TPA: NFACT RNA binding domain-containing protein [Polyangia bacterium]|jgi:predicted ribosome quality control (RQC) complex YloA/Tae2 family protein|nr:NFACT RNA binding domain-containing protein [Polyangia bacterium]